MREVTGYISMVDIDCGNRAKARVIRCGPAVDAGVAADVGPLPVAGDVVGVRQHGFLPSLQCYVGILESGVLEVKRGVDS